MNPDVNILAGGNGSGKSTILNLIGGVLSGGESFEKNEDELIEQVSLILSNDTELSLFRFKETTYESFVEKAKNFLSEKNALVFRQQNGIYYRKNDESFFMLLLNDKNIQIDNKSFSSKVKVAHDLISTIDKKLEEQANKYGELVNLGKIKQARTDFDWEIAKLVEKYKDYQITIGKRAIEALKKGTNGLDEIDAKKKLFLDILDALFIETKKKVDREDSNIIFITSQNTQLNPYQLSSGEKQMLIILLTALVQDNKPSVMIMDEPEISLHTDWQEQLIDNIRNLNPNAQIIIATHSPFIVSKGWASEKYVFQMDKIRKDKLV
ncbi:MAG: ATP-binding protein [Thermoflexibacter sp.]|nr:ATP-binding protein [Thermoflexibacter sp.]